MKKTNTQWKKSTFVSATHVMHRPRHAQRTGKRLTGILRAEKVKIKPEPIIIGAAEESIKIVPIAQNGQIRALRVTCPCGRESTFDIQYGSGGATNELQGSNNGLHGSDDDQRVCDEKNNAA